MGLPAPLKHMQTPRKSQLLRVGCPEGAHAKNIHTHAPALCGNTVFLSDGAVHKLRNKPKFTKPHEEINVCSLWVSLHGAPPRKLILFFKLGKADHLGLSPAPVLLCFRYPDSATHCQFGYHWTTACKSFAFTLSFALYITATCIMIDWV